MFIDTHSHLDVLAGESDFESWMEQARSLGVKTGLITTGDSKGFEVARACAHRVDWAYGLGIHPMFIEGVQDCELEVLDQALEKNIEDARLVAVGEIGLDFYIDNPDKERQERFFVEQMRLAEKYDLPVSVHARRALYRVMAIIKAFPRVKGVIHAFPGSKEEARQIADLGWKLGVGGAVTYPGSKRLRDVVRYAPIDALVLETDCPDMAPFNRSDHRSYPADIATYATIVAELRGESPKVLSEALFTNTLSVFPRLSKLLSLPVL